MCLHHAPSPLRRLTKARRSAVPEGGWTMEQFQGQAGKDLLLDLLSAYRFTMAQAIPGFTRAIRDLLDRHVDLVIQYAIAAHMLYAGKASEERDDIALLLLLPSQEKAWNQGLQQALVNGGADAEVMAAVMPAYQSVGGGIYDKTRMLLTNRPAPSRAQRRITERTRRMAAQVTRINETTRARLETILKESYDKGWSLHKTVKTIREKLPQINAARANTIARTELGRAADQAALDAMEEDGMVTHVSVVGCTAIEKNGPTYGGVPTCNIRNVPIADRAFLQWHPNHRGSVVVSGFKTASGAIPQLAVSGGYE